MRLNRSKIPAPVQLTYRVLRAFEQLHGVYLDTPPPNKVLRSANQQFAVYDEEEVFAGVIVAPDRYFTEETLQEQYYAMLRRLDFPTP